MTFRLVYYSKNSRPDFGRAEIDAILRVSQCNNQKVGITGALMFDEGYFAQVLEGSQSAIEETFERIQMDPRHRDVRIVDFSPVVERAFSQWAMTYAESSFATSASEMTEASGFDPRSFSGRELFQKVATLVFKAARPDHTLVKSTIMLAHS